MKALVCPSSLDRSFSGMANLIEFRASGSGSRSGLREDLLHHFLDFFSFSPSFSLERETPFFWVMKRMAGDRILCRERELDL